MRGAIFDMDGLLFDTERLFRRGWRELAAARGITLDDGFHAAICGCGEAQAAEVLRARFPGDDPRALIAACKARVAGMEELALPLMPGVHEILSGMRARGFRLAVASSSPAEMVRGNVERAGLTAYFDALVSGGAVARGKPFPDIFLYAAARLGLPPEDCYVFEDSRNGIRAAAAAGCVPVMIPDLVPATEEMYALCGGVYGDLSAAWAALSVS